MRANAKCNLAVKHEMNQLGQVAVTLYVIGTILIVGCFAASVLGYAHLIPVVFVVPIGAAMISAALFFGVFLQ